MSMYLVSVFFFFNDTATTEIYTLSLHDALPICRFVKNFKELFGVELAGFLQIFNRDLHWKERIAQLVREAPRQFAPRSNALGLHQALLLGRKRLPHMIEGFAKLADLIPPLNIHAPSPSS